MQGAPGERTKGCGKKRRHVQGKGGGLRAVVKEEVLDMARYWCESQRNGLAQYCLAIEQRIVAGRETCAGQERGALNCIIRGWHALWQFDVTEVEGTGAPEDATGSRAKDGGRGGHAWARD